MLKRARRGLSLALLAVLVLAGSLLAPLAPRASAQATPKQEAVFGTVLEVTPPDVMTVVTGSGSVKLVIGPNTSLKIGSATVALAEVSEGDQVIATATRQTDGSFLGVRVLVRKNENKPVTKHIVGVVVDVTEGQVTIQARGGGTVTVDIPAGLELPAIGDVITTVATFDPQTQRFLIRAFERAASTIERIKEAAEDAKDEGKAKKLREIAEEAREKQLSALEEARRSLERAREAVEAADEAAKRARERLQEIQERFRELTGRYEDEARQSGAEAPRPKARGNWTSSNDSTFVIRSGEDSLEFAYDGETEAAGVAISEEGVQVVINTPGVGRNNQPVLLKDVIAKVPAGAMAIVEYDPDLEPDYARRVTFVELELPKAVRDVVEERARAVFVGVITVVEPTENHPLGVVIVADEESRRKAIAHVTPDTKIVVDGQAASFDKLAAGQKAEVQFSEEAIKAAAGASAAAARGLLDAVAIRTRTTQADEDENPIEGIIRDIAPRERIVVVHQLRGGPVKLHVPDDSRIVKNGAPAQFIDLRVGDLVLDASRYLLRSGIALRLVVHSPREVDFAGVITGIEHTKFHLPQVAASLMRAAEVIEAVKVTVSQRNGDNVEVLVTKDTKVQSRLKSGIGPRDLSIGDVVVEGQMLTVEYNGIAFNIAQTMAIGAPDIESIRGVVARVDAASGALVVEVPGPRGKVELHLPTPASKASLFKNDRPIESLRPVEVGDIVENATFIAKDFIILKLSVVSANVSRIRGQVAKLDAAAGAVVIATRNDGERAVELRVTNETRLTLNGRQVQTLRGVNPGDSASAAYLHEANNGSKGLALVLAVVSSRTVAQDTQPRPAQSVETTVSGKIEAIEGEVWVIAGNKFIVTGKTQFFGQKPEVGLIAKAALKANEEAVLVAIAVSVAGRPDQNPTLRPVDVGSADTDEDDNDDGANAFTLGGVIEATDGTSVVIEGVKFVVTADTTGDVKLIEAGREAKAALVKRDDGVLVAIQISVGGMREIVRPVQLLPRVTVTPVVVRPGELEKIDGRLFEVSGNVVVIGDSKCEAGVLAIAALLRRLNVTALGVATYLRANEVKVAGAFRRTEGRCVIESLDVIGTPVARPPVATPSRPALVTPALPLPAPAVAGMSEKVSAKVEMAIGYVWHIGDRIVIVPAKARAGLREDVKPGARVTIVLRKVDRESLKQLLDEVTFNEVMINPVYSSFVARTSAAVYLADVAELADVSSGETVKVEPTQVIVVTATPEPRESDSNSIPATATPVPASS